MLRKRLRNRRDMPQINGKHRHDGGSKIVRVKQAERIEQQDVPQNGEGDKKGKLSMDGRQ